MFTYVDISDRDTWIGVLFACDVHGALFPNRDTLTDVSSMQDGDSSPKNSDNKYEEINDDDLDSFKMPELSVSWLSRILQNINFLLLVVDSKTSV